MICSTRLRPIAPRSPDAAVSGSSLLFLALLGSLAAHAGGASVLARLVEEVSGTLADEGLTVEVAGPCCRQGLTSPCDPKLPPLRRRLVSVRAHRLAGSIEASRPRSKRPSVRTGLNGLR